MQRTGGLERDTEGLVIVTWKEFILQSVGEGGASPGRKFWTSTPGIRLGAKEPRRRPEVRFGRHVAWI